MTTDPADTCSPIFELSLAELKVLLDAIITPNLPGFAYNGMYLWYSPWKDHCRKVIKLKLLKGSAVFLWGICFDFLPVFNGSGSLHFQRTDKSADLHLFCWPADYWQCHSKQNDTCRFSRFGPSPDHVKSELFRAFQEARRCFDPWFENCSDLPHALTEAQRQREDPDSRCNWPSPDYTAAFLLAANGQAEKGAKVLEQFWNQHCQDFPDSLYKKLQKKLMDCGNICAS